MTGSAIALGLMGLAVEFAEGSRRRPGLEVPYVDPSGRTRPRVPDAIHAALCGCVAVAAEDPDARVWVCDWCGLAVEEKETQR